MKHFEAIILLGVCMIVTGISGALRVHFPDEPYHWMVFCFGVGVLSGRYLVPMGSS